MCCAGCQSVAQAIAAGGFESYYRDRTAFAPGTQDDAAAADDLAIYDLPEVQRGLVREVSGALEAHLLLEGITCAACIWLNEQHVARLARRAGDGGQLREPSCPRALGPAAHPFVGDPACDSGDRLSSLPGQQRHGGSGAQTRGPRCALALVRCRLRHDAGDDVRAARLPGRGWQHERGHHAPDAHRQPGAHRAGGGVGLRPVLSRRVARPQAAPAGDGRPDRAGDCRCVRRQCVRHAYRGRGGLLRLDRDVRVFPVVCAVPGVARAAEGGGEPGVPGPGASAGGASTDTLSREP